MSEETINYDDLSDEEIMNLPIPEDIVESEEVSDQDEEPKVITADDIKSSEDSDNDESQEATPSDEEGSKVEKGTDSEEGSGDPDEPTGDEDEPGIEKEANSKLTIEELLKQPLKVGDTEITINSVEELVTLAQRGLGANKRVQELAPKLKTISMLESNGLMDTEKLNFLIALDKGDPAAIKKLVRSSGVDSFDLNTGNEEEDEEYTGTDYSVTDSEFAVTEAFSNISTTASYNDTLEVIGSFDDTSKLNIQKDPSVIGQLNTHIGDGTYKQIEAVIQKERLMGNLVGVNDFDAYKHVWDTVQENLASMGGNSEAGHKNLTNDQEGRENLAGTGGDQEAGHNADIGKQVSKAQAAAKKAAESTNKNRGSQQAEAINFDDLTDEEIMNLEVSEVFG